MERVINNEWQPLCLEDGTLIPAAGTPEHGPREVELSHADHQHFVDTGRLTLLQPAAPVADNNALENKAPKGGR